MAATRIFEFYRRYQPRLSMIRRDQQSLNTVHPFDSGNNGNQSAPPVLRKPRKKEYKHGASDRSSQLLLSLPTEIVDQIFSHLDERHWHILRMAHRMFKHSAQAALFRQVTLCNFRKTDEPSRVEQLLQLLRDDERLREYVCEVKLASLLDPTVSNEIERLLPEVLVLLKPRKLIISFRELRGSTRSTQENCVSILHKLLKNMSIASFTIEHDNPTAPIISGLSSLKIDAIYLTGDPYPPHEGPNLLSQPWLDSLAQSTIKRLDLGDWQVSPGRLTTLFDSLTNLVALSMTVVRTASHSEILSLIRSKQHVLRELGLRRLPLCHQNIALPAILDLSKFKTLDRLTIDASFLFGAAYCSPSAQPVERGPNPYVRELIARAEASVLLPPNLRNLNISFNAPQQVFSLGQDSLQSRSPHVPRGGHGLEFDWMLEIVRRQRRLKHFKLIEERHVCEERASTWNPLPISVESQLVRFKVPEVMNELFIELGCQMNIWVQYRVPIILN